MTTDNTQVGRNEPCPCGSTKKYKRCCGKDAAPKLGAPLDMAKRLERMNLGGAKGGAAGEGPGSGANPMAGFDPSQLDPAWMAQVQQSMSRLPRGQLQRIQALMSRAMSGKDVSREAAELERLMPPEFLEMMRSGPMAQMMAPQSASGSTDMSVEEAKRLVSEAAEKGEISATQAEELLANVDTRHEGGKLSKFWKGLTGKK